MHRFWGAALALTAAAGVTAAADAKDMKPDKSLAKPPVLVEPLPPDVLAEAVRAEQDAYIRRLDVCTRLKQVAAEKNDDKLALKAADLERAATTLYEQRVAKLGVKPSGRPAPLAELDKKLGSGAAVNPLTVAPPKPASASLAELREVKP
jgi:hypothetical protein